RWFPAFGGRGRNDGPAEAWSLVACSRKAFAQRGPFGRYLAGGYLTYLNQGTLFAVGFDADRMRVAAGSPIPVLKDVAYSWAFGFGQLDVSRTGTLVYRRSLAHGELIGQWVEPSGRTETVVANPPEDAVPSPSPDGRRVAVTRIDNGAPSLWIFDRQSNQMTRASTQPDGYGPTWTRDGKMLIVGGPTGMRWLTPDGARSGPLTKPGAV